MKIDGIIKLLATSRYREESLFLLYKSPLTLSEIKTHFKVTSPEIHPRLKELIATGIVTKKDECYSITPLGRTVMDYYAPLLGTVETIENNCAFWKEHDITPIPEFLLHRLKDLHNCSFVQSSMCNQFEPHKEFTYWVANATSIKGIVGVFNPTWVPWFSEVSELGIPIELIVTKEVYAKIEREYVNELRHGLQNKNAHVYVYDGELKVAASTMRTLEGTFFSFGLHFLSSGQYDNNLDLQGCDEESFEWGEELFGYYKEMAEEVPREQVVNEYIYSERENLEVKISNL